MTDSLTVHQSALVIDTHADTPQRFLDEGWSFTDPLGRGMINAETAWQGNLAAEFFAMWVDPTQHPESSYAQRTIALIEATLEQVRNHPEQLTLCLSPDDILTAHASKRFAVLMGIEGGHSIQNELELLRVYHRMGARYMTLTWSNTNDWADSSGDAARHDGLTAFGKEVIAEMNRLGMMIDVSHASDKTFWDVISESRAPIIASHSSARALTPAARNLTDEMISAIARGNGSVMVNFFSAFIDEEWRGAWSVQSGERRQAQRVLAEACKGKPVPYALSDQIDREFAAKIKRAPLESLIDHFDHVIQVAGIDHVGIGTDFDGIPALPEGIDSAADLPKITEALMQRGYTAEEMHKLLGGNLLRVFREVQAAAK